MCQIVTRCVTVISLLLLVIALAACGGEPATPAQQGPSGDELVTKMKEAVKAINSAHFTAEFQVASVEGPVKGTVEFWGERPGKMRGEVTSETASVNGIVAVTDGQKGWAYNPSEKIVVVSDKSQYKTQLRDQPELRDIVNFGETILNRGFDNTEAVNQGAEQVNGRNTYKVQVTYGKSSDPKLDLEGVTSVFWIDQETFLPQRIEISVQHGALTASGFAVLKGDIAKNETIDAAKFTFSPPAGAAVLDLSKLPELPTLKNLPKIQP
jgi:outer membrane lipoprotein-sorting protein